MLGRKCFCGFNLIFIFGKKINCIVKEKFREPIIRMNDTVKYCNIIPCDTTLFLVKYLYGVITYIHWVSKCIVLLWKMVRNICLYDS